MLILKRHPELDEANQYLVEHRGKVVGRIFKDLTARPTDPPSWFWGLSHPYERGSKKPHYGNAGSKEEAMRRFKSRWLLSNVE